MIEAFLPVLMLMALGIVYRLFAGVENAAKARHVIGSVVFTVLLPVLAFHVLSTAPIDSSLITVPIVAGVTTLLSLGIAWLVIPRMHWLPAPSIGALLIAAAWGNATYLGFPVITNLMGLKLQRVPLLFDMLAITPLLFTVGVMICVEYGVRGPKHTMIAGLRQAITTPAIVGAAVGLAVNLLGIRFPLVVGTALSSAGSLVPPLMLFSVGLALRPPTFRMAGPLTPVLIIKLLVAPLIGYGVGHYLIADPEVFKATLLETAMPTMILPMVFAERYGLDEELLAQAILWTTVVAMVTLPLIAG